MRSIALVSAYREGALVQAAVRTGLQACGRVLVFDGAAGAPHERGLESDYRPFSGNTSFRLYRGRWDSDAGKRTAMLTYVRERPWFKRHDGPVWGVWIDGDEALLWPEMLGDYLVKVVDEQPDAVAMSIKIVEADGTVADCGAKVIRVDLVEAVLQSSYQVKCFGSDAVLSLGNSPSGSAPLPGEPHLIHRSFLRPADRAADRLHEREPEWFDERAAAYGLPVSARDA